MEIETLRAHFVDLIMPNGKMKQRHQVITYSELPLYRLHQLLVGQVRVFPAGLDLLWQLVLVPEVKERERKE